MMLNRFATPAVFAPEGSGGSILAEAALAAPAAPPPPAPGTAEAHIQQSVDGPPDWVPEKFWDRDKKTPRYEDMGRGYKSLEQLLSRDKVPVPVSDEDNDGWQRWYTAAGRPEKPEAYEFDRPKELPKDLPYDEDMEKAYRQWAFENGLNKRQMRNGYDWFVKSRIEQAAAYQKMVTENRSNAEVAMRREHGARYDGFVQSAGAVFKKYADPEFDQYITESGLGNDPRFIRVFGRIAKDMGGETALNGRPQQQAQPADIERAISDFNKQHKEALWDKKHPDHDRLVKERSRMFDTLYPEQGVL